MSRGFADACLMPYIGGGDVCQCWLPRGHRGTCTEANETRRRLTFDALAEVDRQFDAWNAETTTHTEEERDG